MKYSTLLLLSSFMVATSCKEKNEPSQWLPDVKNQNHGSAQEKEFVGNFNEIEVTQSIEAEIVKSDVEKVVIKAPSNVINDILVERDNDEITIKYRPGIRVMNANNVKAIIYAKDFEKLKATSAAIITVKDKFMQEKTEIEASGAAEISGNFGANDLKLTVSSSGVIDSKIWAIDLEIEASSAGEMRLKGKAKNAEISTSSSSSVKAKDVIVDHVKADASSSADIEVSAFRSLEGEASSAGSITIYKNGELSVLKKDESSGGSITIR